MIVPALRSQLGFTDFTVTKNFEGISHEDALRLPAAGGSSMNWVLGHMLYARSGIVALLGAKPLSTQRHNELYERGSDPSASGEDAETLETLLELWTATHRLIDEGLDQIEPAKLDELVPNLFDPTKMEPAALKVASLAFHDSYHAGQLGTLRRELGKPGAIQ